MANYFFGQEAVLLYGTAGAAVGALVEMTNVKDVNLDLTAAEADTTTRDNDGWEGVAATRKSATLTWEMVAKTTDAGFTAVQEAFIDGTTIELLALDQPLATITAQGPKASWSITGFSRAEPLDGVVIYSVTAKVQTFDEWYHVTS